MYEHLCMGVISVYILRPPSLHTINLSTFSKTDLHRTEEEEKEEEEEEEEEEKTICVTVLERSVRVFSVLHNINPWSPLFSK